MSVRWFIILFTLLSKVYCSITLKHKNKQSVDNELSTFAKGVVRKYMANCITIVSELHGGTNFQFDTDTVLRLSYNGSKGSICDNELIVKIEAAFDTYCSKGFGLIAMLLQSYVIQISKPECFFPIWVEANIRYRGRKHTPRTLFIPLLPLTLEYSDVLYNVDETKVSADIIVAEFVDNNDSDVWHLNIFTNNFGHTPPYNQGEDSRIFLGSWYPGSPLDDITMFGDKMKNLHGKDFNLCIIDYPAYSNLEPYGGTETALYELFCEMSNCTIKPYISTTGYWGEIDHANKSGTGCAGEVFLGKADACIGAYFAWSEYWPYLDYSVTYYYGDLIILVPKPVLIGGWLTPFLPFSGVIWISISISLIISSISLYYINYATLKYIPDIREKLEINGKFLTIPDSLLRSIGMMVLQQPTSLVPGSPVRHLFTAMEILYLVITTCYAAELYDFLTIPRTTKPIENFRDMADANIIWMANDEAFVFGAKHADDPQMKKMIRNFETRTTEEIIRLAEGGGRGVANEKMIGGHYVEMDYVTNKFIDMSIAMKEPYIRSSLVSYLNKGSPYTERVNQIIGRMLNSGIWFKWEEASAFMFFNYEKQQKLLASTRPVKYPPKVLRVGDLEGAFALYFCGVVLSFMTLAAEFYIVRKQKYVHIKHLPNINRLHDF